jgi:outer membrane protein assembly factor BamB
MATALSQDGKCEWSFSSGDQHWQARVGVGPCITKDDDVLLASYQCLLCLSRDGKEKWKCTTHGGLKITPKLDAVGNIYFGTTAAESNGSVQSYFYCLSSNGEVLWQKEISDSFTGTECALWDGEVFFCTGHILHELSTADGSVQRETEVGRIYSTSPVISNDGILYLCTFLGDVLAFDTRVK